MIFFYKPITKTLIRTADAQAGLHLCWLQTTEDRFFHGVANFIYNSLTIKAFHNVVCTIVISFIISLQLFKWHFIYLGHYIAFVCILNLANSYCRMHGPDSLNAFR